MRKYYPEFKGMDPESPGLPMPAHFITPKNRPAFHHRPLRDYSMFELEAVLRLEPHNKDFLNEVCRRLKVREI